MKRPPLNEEGKRLFELAMRVLPGLLASGHFTYGGEEYDGRGIACDDMGKEWYEDSMCRYSMSVVDSAMDAVRQLEDECWRATAPNDEQEKFFEEQSARHSAMRERKQATQQVP